MNLDQFSDGQSVEELRHDLQYGQVEVNDIPLIHVIKTRSGNVWSLNNRRLWCFRHARNIHKIPVRIVDQRPPWFNKRIQKLQNPFQIRLRAKNEETDCDTDGEDGWSSEDYD